MELSPVTRERGLAPHLHTRADVASIWSNTAVGFDEAAELFVRRHRDDGALRDEPIADLRTWGFRAIEGHFALQPLGRHRGPLLLRSNGLSNLCTRLSVPVEFLRRLPAPLELAILNWSLSDLDSAMPVTLRTRNDEVQAVVSDKYAPLDAEQLVSTLRDVLVRHGLLESVRVRAVATGMTDALRITFPERAIEAKVGDITHAGINLSSSSFARAALRVYGVLFRLACRNGAVIPQRMGDFSARHVGDTQRLRDFLADAVPAAMTHATGLMDSWRRAVAIQVEHLAEVISSMRELTLGEREVVEHQVKEETGTPELPESTSLYTLVNALTAAAQKVDTARRLELESVAGGLLVERVRAS